MIVNTFLGNTQLLAGATYLSTRALIQIEEGYNAGSAIEYVNLGEYLVEDISNEGFNSQNIRISLSNKLRGLEINSSPYPNSLSNHNQVSEHFLDSDTLFNYTISDSDVVGITNSSLHISGGSSQVAGIDTRLVYEDLRLTYKFNKGASNGWISALFRTHDGDNTYEVRPNGNSSLLTLLRKKQGIETILGTASVTFGTSTNYWVMVNARGRALKVYSSTDGKAFTERISTSDHAFIKGAIGFKASASSTSWIDFMEAIELKNRFNTEEDMKHILGLGGIFGASFQNTLYGFNTLETSPGASWVVGSSNEVTVYQAGASTSLSRLMTSGSTFNDFVVEVEMYSGASGNKGGLVLGISDNFYGNYHALQPTTNNTIIHRLSTTNTLYTNMGNHINLQKDKWYSLKLVKSGFFLGWYVNGVLANQIYGLSLNDTTLAEGNRVGVFVEGSGNSSMVFRNLRIGRFDQLVEDTTVSPNQPIRYSFDRFMVDGIVENWTTNSVNIFEIGASRGEHNIGLSQYVMNLSEITSNSAGLDISFAQGDESLGLAVNTNPRVIAQADSSVAGFWSDSNLVSLEDARNLAVFSLQQSNRSIVGYELTVQSNSTRERYDKINLVSSTLGVSDSFLIYNFSRSYDPGRASFIDTYELGK